MNPLNLPPGCTMNQVDPPMVDCPECDGSREVEVPFDLYGEAGYSMRECRRCDGTGEVRKDTVEE